VQNRKHSVVISFTCNYLKFSAARHWGKRKRGEKGKGSMEGREGEREERREERRKRGSLIFLDWKLMNL
jgi:hypothetical protein